MYQVLFARSPAPDELQIGQAFLEAGEEADPPGTVLTNWQQYAQLLLMSNAFIFVD